MIAEVPEIDFEKEINYGCDVTKPICYVQESLARGLGSYFQWLTRNVLAEQQFHPGTTLFHVATDAASGWIAPATYVLIITAMIGFGWYVLTLQLRKFWLVVVSIFLFFPSIIVTFRYGGQFLHAVDAVSNGFIDYLQGPGGLALLLPQPPDSAENLITKLRDLGSAALTIINPVGGWFFHESINGAVNLAQGKDFFADDTFFDVKYSWQFILTALLGTIGMLLVAFALAFRNFMLLALLGFMPLALMTIGLTNGWGVMKKWVSTFVALLLAKPLLLGMLVMLMQLARQNYGGFFSGTNLVVLVGLFVCAFMPFAAVRLFNWVGAEAERNAGSEIAPQVNQNINSKTSQTMYMLPSLMRGLGGRTGAGRAGAAGVAGAGAAGVKPGAGQSGSGDKTKTTDKQTPGSAGSNSAGGSGGAGGAGGRPEAKCPVCNNPVAQCSCGSGQRW